MNRSALVEHSESDLTITLPTGRKLTRRVTVYRAEVAVAVATEEPARPAKKWSSPLADLWCYGRNGTGGWRHGEKSHPVRQYRYASLSLLNGCLNGSPVGEFPPDSLQLTAADIDADRAAYHFSHVEGGWNVVPMARPAEAARVVAEVAAGRLDPQAAAAALEFEWVPFPTFLRDTAVEQRFRLADGSAVTVSGFDLLWYIEQGRVGEWVKDGEKAEKP